MAATESSSSSGALNWAMSSGATSLAPDVEASFRVGSNGAPGEAYEYALETFSGEAPLGFESERLTWDPLFGESAKPFTCSAQVNLDVASRAARWSVGTSPLIACRGPELASIHTIEFEAA